MAEKENDTVKDSLSLVDRILIAQQAVGVIKKDGQNSFQHYSFQSEGAIKDAVKPALIKAGLVIKFSYEIVNQYDRTTGKGGNNHFVDLMGTFTVTDGHDIYHPGQRSGHWRKSHGQGQHFSAKVFLQADV